MPRLAPPCLARLPSIIRPGLLEAYHGPLYSLRSSSLRALAAEVLCELLCLLARLGVDHDLAYRYPAVVADVGALILVVVILSGLVRVGCARLYGVHS
jgi:hypothetical protein